jgi:hypothetical protein
MPTFITLDQDEKEQYRTVGFLFPSELIMSDVEVENEE